ncbi:universal stress protein [Fodinibius salsisoli]|uniref:Universal stress protein n=1 Tax=Fodinibius salsisoli TaxID=2820877 RepID=A0ABT3PJT5_9BACT|nr:universal stress protein [Fodinibius salsisoli]MCW9706187.1 universal stress protein [Fodinibius salsisoli]
MMKSFKHWMIGLDLTNMDKIITGYASFLSDMNAPDRITFFHIVEHTGIDSELQDLFPEVKDKEPLKTMIGKELRKKYGSLLKGFTPDVDIVIKEGKPTKAILSLLEEEDPDLLILGKKSGYEGEGILPRQIVKYAHCSTLFVSENTHYNLDNVLVPVTFSKASARAVKQGKVLTVQYDAELHLQHVYEYPKQFFPYIPSEKYAERMNEYLQKKLDKFREKYKLGKLPECRFSVNEDGREINQIYDYALHTQTDMIVVGSKRKSSTAALLTDSLADHMAEYHFGCPAFIYKEKREHSGLLKSLLDQD